MPTSKQVAALIIVSGAIAWTPRTLSFAGDVRVPLPKGSQATPVQNLNREGVRDLKKGNKKKAKQVFYKAYLLDPNDPFTLNNLGYIAELDGDTDRALRFYALAVRNQTDAVIDVSSRPGLRGQEVSKAFAAVDGSDIAENKINEQAIALLEKGRVSEAKALLKGALSLHQQSAFLLNNLGYVMESEGDLESALRFYSAAASLHSNQRIVLTPRAKWRGRPISEVAAENAREISEILAKGEDTQAAVARLNLQGVTALNENHPDVARAHFLKAYHLDPQNAFTLNNIGYISEVMGDRESANMYYEAARQGVDAGARVTYSTRTEVEGRKLNDLAQGNEADVNSVLKGIQEAKRRAGNPVTLKTRGEPTSGNEPAKVPPIGVKNPPLPLPPLPDAGPQTNPPAVTPSPSSNDAPNNPRHE